ncbi:MAG: hypothetical protein H7Y32_05340 [Chloroflexales bacterium]|nr:hypothetical protein [Chloroflexales bacterium]
MTTPVRQPLYATLAYRVRQFRAALAATVGDDEHALVARLLAPAELPLFEAMPAYDQRHCLDVFYTLRAAGHDDILLLRAALFHDCGKLDDDGTPMSLPWYITASLLKALAPPLYRVLAEIGRGPLRPLRVYAEHAWRGSRMAARAGSPPTIVQAIRHYHDKQPTGLAAQLQWADEQH